MVKAVIFDMFETLVTMFEGRTYYSEDIAADMGVDTELFRREWQATENDRTVGKMTSKEGLTIAFKKLGVFSEESVRLTAAKRYEAISDTFERVPDESLQLLKELRKAGIKTALITNTFSDECEIIRKSRLYPLFDEALISYELGMRKPDPEIYRAALERLGVKAEECLYVGDGGSRELFGARDAGMKPVQAVWFRSRAYEPHIACPIYEEFPQAEKQLDILGML